MDKKKILIIVTGRGIGGDAGTALNVYNALEKRGYDCEIALDESAPGLLFKKKELIMLFLGRIMIQVILHLLKLLLTLEIIKNYLKMIIILKK